MKSQAKRLLSEAPIDFGGMPDFIDPEKKRKISQNQTPYGDNPAFPREKPPRRAGAPYGPDTEKPDPTSNYSELVASATYPEIVKKVQRYTGQDPRQMRPQMLMQQMMQAMQQAVQLEGAHRRELERAAVDVVLDLPEFSGARRAVQNGKLRIEAKLLDPRAMMQAMQQRIQGLAQDAEDEEDEASTMQVQPGEDTEEERGELGLDIPEIAGQYDAEAKKRRFVNLLIQGAAINKNYAYHMAAEQLRRIDPNILTTYGKLMSIAELMYWVMPEDVLNQAMGSGQGGGGMEEIDQEDDGVWVVRASALVFPVLIQELAKGLYEYLSHNEDDPEDVRKYAYKKSDTLASEQWDIMKGPGVWRHFVAVVDAANGTDVMPQLYRYLVTRSPEEFNRVMQDILKETPAGRRYIADLVRRIKERNQRKSEQNESLARNLFRR